MLNSKKHAMWYFVPFVLLLLSVVSCQKEVKVQTSGLPESNVRFPKTSEEKALVDKIKIVESILRKIYIDPKIRDEVNAAIKCGYYNEEAVELKDLLNPGTSKLYASNRFQRLNVEKGVFERKFKEEFNKLSGGANTGNRTNDDYFEENGITIYFPYSENFINAGSSEITLVAADRDADQGPGNKPDGTNPDGSIKYTPVTVDDDYADVTPTHIVGVVDDLKPLPVDSIPPPPPTLTIDRVFHGVSRLGKNYDKLISFTGNGGGSEMKIARISGYLQVQNQQVTNFTGDVVSVNYKRSDVKRRRWKIVYSVWDADWVAANNEQTYAVYEEDTEGSQTFSGSLSTTVIINAGPPPTTGTGTIGFSVTVKTQDEIVTQRKIGRTAYFLTAKQDQGAGFNMCENPCSGHGVANPCQDNTFLPPNQYWPIWDCGTDWKYLWPYKIYN